MVSLSLSSSVKEPSTDVPLMTSGYPYKSSTKTFYVMYLSCAAESNRVITNTTGTEGLGS